jgi:RNA polymerase sigma factor for flagellar operon FliA
MTEPTPDPDNPGEGLRTRLAPEGRARVAGARSGGAHGTGTLVPEARDMTPPTNGTATSRNGASTNGMPTNGTRQSTRNGTNGTHNGSNGTRSGTNGAPHGRDDTRNATNGVHTGTIAFVPNAYGDVAHNDNMDVDAASHGTAPGNVANDGDSFAGAAARPPAGINGAHASNGHAKNGHGINGHATNGHATNGQGANGQSANSQSAIGQSAIGRVDNGQSANDQLTIGRVDNRRAADSQAALGRADDGESGSDESASGQAASGRAVNGYGSNGHVGNGHVGNGHVGNGYVGNGHVGNGHLGMGQVDDAQTQPFVNGTHARATSVTFGFGETAGVLPGDQRTFDDVEAGIVALWRRFGERREQPLRDRLVLHYAPLVKYVAGRVGTGLPAHVEVADLIQSGIFGLVDAIEKFEPERGLKFETYAMQRIRGAILDDLRAQDWVPRSVRGRAREVERALERLGAQLRRTPTDAELADELGLSLHELRDVYAQLQLTSVVALDELAAAGRGPTPLADILEDQEALDPVALLVDQDNRRQLAQAIAHLAERDRVVVTLYYFENLTLAEIGRVLGVTESRVCQLHTRAVLRLRAKLLEKSEA